MQPNNALRRNTRTGDKANEYRNAVGPSSRRQNVRFEFVTNRWLLVFFAKKRWRRSSRSNRFGCPRVPYSANNETSKSRIFNGDCSCSTEFRTKVKKKKKKLKNFKKTYYLTITLLSVLNVDTFIYIYIYS